MYCYIFIIIITINLYCCCCCYCICYCIIRNNIENWKHIFLIFLYFHLIEFLFCIIFRKKFFSISFLFSLSLFFCNNEKKFQLLETDSSIVCVVCQHFLFRYCWFLSRFSIYIGENVHLINNKKHSPFANLKTEKKLFGFKVASLFLIFGTFFLDPTATMTKFLKIQWEMLINYLKWELKIYH